MFWRYFIAEMSPQKGRAIYQEILIIFGKSGWYLILNNNMSMIGQYIVKIKGSEQTTVK